MKHAMFALVACLAVGVVAAAAGPPAVVTDCGAVEAPSKLGVVWTSGDRDVALKMAFMYTSVAQRNGWWDGIRLIIWGPSSKLLSEDEELQGSVAALQELGVEVVACKACADLYGVSEKLEELGIEVRYVGGTLTEQLKAEDWVTTTF
jgi:hypothetical protein